jgi:hypothetical protein
VKGVATIPEFFWELFLGIYCTFKGFKPSAPILQAGFRQSGSLAAPEVGPA